MIRFCVSLLLSVLIHAALLAALSLIPSQSAALPQREVMRIVLAGTAEPEPAPAPATATETHPRAVSPPEATAAPFTPPEPVPKIERAEPLTSETADETRDVKVIKKIEPPRPKPIKETPKARAAKKMEPAEPKRARPANKTSESETVKKAEPPKPGTAPAVSIARRVVPIVSPKTEISGALAEPAKGEEHREASGGASNGPAPPPVVVDAERLRVTRKVSPEYPMISRKRRDQGSVVLLVKIVSGRVASTEIERGSGHAPLDESAARAVRGWLFDTSGYGAEVTARVRVSFELK